MAGRRCPSCGLTTEDALCPKDGMATLLASAPPSDPARVAPGQVLAGRYRVVELLKKGASGAVFAAQHTGTGKDIALKVLAAREGDTLDRFFLEARATAKLAHPNTVRVFDFGQDDSGAVYIAMELLAGKTLKEAMAERFRRGVVFSEEEARRLAVGVLGSLAEAHAAGLVHRDLKPDNLFLHEVAGEAPAAKVLDFGVGAAPRRLAGTPAYMSPEQVREDALDGRSDLYALAVVLYQMVTARLPFAGATPAETRELQVKAPPPPLAGAAQVALSEPFASAVMRALAKDPAERFRDAAEMRAALLGEAPVAARAPPAAPPVDAAREPASRVHLAAIAVAAAAGIGVVAWMNLRPHADPREEVATAEVGRDAQAAVESPPAAAAQPVVSSTTAAPAPPARAHPRARAKAAPDAGAAEPTAHEHDPWAQ